MKQILKQILGVDVAQKELVVALGKTNAPANMPVFLTNDLRFIFGQSFIIWIWCCFGQLI